MTDKDGETALDYAVMDNKGAIVWTLVHDYKMDISQCQQGLRRIVQELLAEEERRQAKSQKQQQDPSTSISTQEPEMADLCKMVIPRVAACWDTLADYLRLELSRVDIIRQKHPNDPERCCREVFVCWLR